MSEKRLMTKAWKAARDHWKLRVFVERGRRLDISDKLFGFITETLAIVYIAGFKAGEKAGRKWANK